MARIPKAFNARGYIGEIHPAGTADENQIGGHNALLRGFSEYYLWHGDERALAAMRSVNGNLMLPSRPLYAEYPDKILKGHARRPAGLDGDVRDRRFAAAGHATLVGHG